MNLGVERYKLGDILIDGNQAYLICMADMADYICAELKRVRHTSVYCEVEAGLPAELTEPKTERKEDSGLFQKITRAACQCRHRGAKWCR